MSRHIKYDFHFNEFKSTFDNVQWLGQDIYLLIVQLSDKYKIVHMMCGLYKSFDKKLDNTSYFYGQLVNNYDQEVDKSKFFSLTSFLNINKKLTESTFKDKHNRHCITKFVGLTPRCIAW